MEAGNKCFQIIDDNKALAHVLGKKGMHIKVVMFLKIYLAQQDNKNFNIKNILGRVLFLIFQKILEHPTQVYILSHILPSNPPSIVVPKVSIHQMTLIHM